MSRGPVIVAHADQRSALAIARSFARSEIPFVAAVVRDHHFTCFSRYVRGHVARVANPHFEPERFASEIIQLADARGAAGILPVTDPAMGALNAARKSIPEAVRLMTPGEAAIDAVLDKDRNLEIAADAGIPYPPTADVNSIDDVAPAAAELGYPVILKRSSREAVLPEAIDNFTAEKMNSETELERLVDRLRPHGVVPQLQKFVVGEMHNICCFAVHGQVVAAHEHISIRRSKHTGIARKVVPTDPLRLDYATRLLAAIDWEGVAGVSFLVSEDGKQNWYLETNGRFWASVQGSINAGWDLPAWAARYYLRDEAPPPPAAPDMTRITVYHRSDLAALIEYLRGGRAPVTTGHTGKLRAIGQYLRAFGPGYRSDVFRWNDPLPAIVDHGQLLSGYARGLVRRARGGRR